MVKKEEYLKNEEVMNNIMTEDQLEEISGGMVNRNRIQGRGLRMDTDSLNKDL